MKKIFYSLFVFLFCAGTYAQEGPGGIGSSSNNILWLDASNLSLNNNDLVSSWLDQSGNSNNADQVTSSFQPTFKTSQLNGHAAIEFDGNDNYLELTNHITTGDISYFVIYSKFSSNIRALLNTNKHFLFSEGGRATPIYGSPETRYRINKSDNSFSVFSAHTDGSTSGSNLSLYNGSNSSSFTRTSIFNTSTSAVGARISGTYGMFFSGQIAEVIIYNAVLNSAQRRIISSYLAAKYNLAAEQELYNYKTTYNNAVKGVGQESDGSNTTARALDSLEVSNPSSLGDGDYLLVGHDNGGYGTSSSVGADMVERWNQVWRVTQTGTPGTVDLEFFLGANGFASPTNYVVLIETADGDFSNGGVTSHEAGRTFDAGNVSIKFTGVNLPDGAYFTLAEKLADIESITSGEWENTATWSCSCIPTSTDVVTVKSPHLVQVNDNASALNLTLESGASMSFDGSDTLSIFNSFSIAGTFTAGNGTVAALSTNANDFSNSSSNRVDFNNLYVNSTDGLNLTSGGWAVSNDLQVSSGGIDVTSADSVVLLSTASKTSQILSSMSNGFTGEFIIQRHIGSRNANFSNMSSPISDATFNDLDDDLILSGIGGLNGNATVNGGGTFYSISSYDNINSKHDTVTDVNASMIAKKGYEVYLYNTLSTFNGATVDYRGTPNSGDQQLSYANRVTKGWNLLGNPYHSFIDWSLITIPQIANDYYIYNTDNGTYELKSSTTPIAPGQGFWVFQPNGGGYRPTFTESSKVSSNSATFLRQRELISNFKLRLQSLSNSYAHEMHLNFNMDASSYFDEYDKPLLPSPIKEAPAITAQAFNSSEELIYNSLSPLKESHLIPLSIYAGVEGKYAIEAQNIDDLFGNYSCVYLKDNINNESIDLMVDQKYEFDSEFGKSDRFSLILSNDYSECHALLEDKSFNQKIESNLNLRNQNQNWFIDYNFGKDYTNVEIDIYNMSGQQVKSTILFSASEAGTFMLPQLNDLEGIFLIQVRSKEGVVNKTIKL